MIYLRQSTASQEVPLGYFVDSTDGNTEETALTIANTDIKIWKTGATTLANKNSGGATHISNGIYYGVFDATDTDTIGPLVIFVHVSGALTVRLECCVLDEAVYDSLFGTSALTTGGALTITSGRVNADVTHIATAAVNTSSAQLGVNVVNAAGTAWNSGAIGATTIADGAIDRATFAADTGLQTARSNTAQAGAATSITLDASASATTDFYKHCLVYLTGGTGVGQYRLITAYNGTTKVATTTPAWATNPDVTSTFGILPKGIANVEAFGGTAGTFSSGRPEVNTTHWLGTAAATPTVAGVPEVDVTHFNGTAGTFSSGRPEVNTTHWGGTAVASANVRADLRQILGTAPTEGGAGRLAGSFTTLLDVAAPVLTTASVNQTGDSFARIGAAGAGLTDLGGFSTTAKAQIQTEAEDAIVVHRLDELLNADSDIDGAAPPTVGSVFHELMTKTAGSFTFDQTTDSLEALRDRGDAAWITATGFSTHTAADVWTSGTRTLTAATNITSTGGTTFTQTGDSFVRLGAPVGVSISADIAGVQADTDNIQTRIPAALVGGRMDSDVAVLQANVITATSIADSAFTNAKFNADTGFKAIRQSTAQAGAASTITLDASASATDDLYNNCDIVICSGTGAGQTRHIRDYVGSTKVATIAPAWTATPDATSAFAVLPRMSAWDQVTADHLASGTTGNALNAAGSAGDPWGTALPGAYGAGTAGAILGALTSTNATTLQTTTIATLASQTSFTLTAGSADNDAYNGCLAIITDSVTAAQKAVGIVLDYTGSTKTVTLAYDPAVFTMAAGDSISIIGDRALPPQIRKNTAYSNFEFLMVDSTDMKTEETGLTVTATRSIDGGSFAACTNSVSEVSSGIYKINLSAADLNGDYITFRFTATGAATRIIPIATQPY